MDNFDKFNRFTKEAKQALIVAQEKAKEAKVNFVGSEHILLGVLSQENSLGASILLNFGVSLDNVNLVLKTVGKDAPTETGDKDPYGLSGFAKEVIEEAVKIAHQYGHAFIGTEHLLYGLVTQSQSAATVILENMKITSEDVKEQILEIFERAKKIQTNKQGGAATATPPNGSPAVNPIELFLNGLQGVMSQKNEPPYKKTKKNNTNEDKQSFTPALDYFSNDLVVEARQGKIEPIIGRATEIERVVSILSRKTKNNPILIGEAGVGKTAVAEGLALAVAEERVPENLLDIKILSISMANVVAGTKYRGEFEDRVRQIIEEASSKDNIVLFIDEFHTIIGAGSAEGSLDAANILKPALSRGKIQMIGATTTQEYRKHVEKDSALERRFQPVLVKEPSKDDTLAILKGLRTTFEDHHSLLITDEAIIAAVDLSKRYINDRFLPDKAIDLLDEAAAKMRIKTKINHEKIRKHQKKLASLVKRKETAVSQQDYEKAADLRNEELQMMKKIEELKISKIPRSQRKKLEENNIADVVSNMTGVPVTKLLKDDIDRLKGLESAIKEELSAKKKLLVLLLMQFAALELALLMKKTYGSFIFMGPTGVGKTELVKTIAEEVYNDLMHSLKLTCLNLWTSIILHV